MHTRRCSATYSTCTCTCITLATCGWCIIHVLMRDEKEGRSKQGQTNKQGKGTQHTQGSHFSEKMSCLEWDLTHDTLYSRQRALPLRSQGSSAGCAQISHLIVNLTSHSTPDANHQLSMNEKKTVVMKPPKTPNTKHQTEYVHVLMRDEKEERKMQARSNKQTIKAVTFPGKNELPQVGLENPRHSTL